MSGSSLSTLTVQNFLSSRQRRIPRIEESFYDCGYLFRQFRKHLKSSGHAGIVAINFLRPAQLPEITTKTISFLIRMTEKKLAGRIEGGYKAGVGEYFLLLVPTADYSEAIFQQDMDRVRRELLNYLTFPHATPKSRGENVINPDVVISIEGVLLTNCPEEKVDNALFRAFQSLFTASTVSAHEKSPEQQEIEEIVNAGLISPVYQPIFDLGNGNIHGYEALSRIVNPRIFANPEELFASSRKYGLTSPLEMLCRKKALIGAKELGISERLFVNVCPALLQASDHERGFTAALLDELDIKRSRVTFELTERTMIEDYVLFNRVLSHYREQGYSIAIDDLGSGFAGLKMLAELEPEYVKLSRFLISGIDTSDTKQALVEALVTFCNRIGARVIAEGIERPEELEYLAAAGVPLGQGYLLAKPAPQPLPDSYIPPCLSHLATGQPSPPSLHL